MHLQRKTKSDAEEQNRELLCDTNGQLSGSLWEEWYCSSQLLCFSVGLPAQYRYSDTITVLTSQGSASELLQSMTISQLPQQQNKHGTYCCAQCLA